MYKKLITQTIALSLLAPYALAQSRTSSIGPQEILRQTSEFKSFDMSSIRITKVDHLEDRTIFRLQQYANGVPVRGAEAIVAVDSNKRVLYVESKFTQTSIANLNLIDIQTILNSYEVRATLTDLLDRDDEEAVHVSANEISEARRAILTATIEAQNTNLEFVTTHQEARLVYVIQNINAGDYTFNGIIEVDASTGKVLDLKNSGAHKHGHIHKKTTQTETTTKPASQSLYTPASTLKRPNLIVYTGNLLPLVPIAGKGKKLLTNGKRESVYIPKAARDVNDTLSLIVDFFAKIFNRSSYDNMASPVEAIINVQKIRLFDILGLQQNAAWFGQKKVFIFGGGGDILDNFEKSIDVVGHEFTHAVIESTSNLAYEGESGALNEHLADVFGEMIQVKSGRTRPGMDFLIGEDVVTDSAKKMVSKKQGRAVLGLRDMLVPSRGLSPQPGHTLEIEGQYGAGCQPTSNNDYCGVHINSGVPNRAISLMVQQLGWDKVGHLVYRVMVSRLTSRSDFRDYANSLINECRISMQARDCEVIDASLTVTGMR